MSDQPNGIHITKGKAAAGGLAAAVVALLGAYLGQGGEIMIPTPPPHPAVTARLDAVEDRLEGVERQLSDPTLRQETIALQREVSALNSRLDLLLRWDDRRLRGPGAGD